MPIENRPDFYLHILGQVKVFCGPPQVDADGGLEVVGGLWVDGGVGEDDGDDGLGVAVIVVLPERLPDHRVGLDVQVVVAAVGGGGGAVVVTSGSRRGSGSGRRGAGHRRRHRRRSCRRCDGWRRRQLEYPSDLVAFVLHRTLHRPEGQLKNSEKISEDVMTRC